MCDESKKYSLQGKTILILGATSDIAAQCALDFSLAGAKLFLAGRNETALKKLSGLCPNSECFAADFTDKTQMEKLYSWLKPLDGVLFASGQDSTKILKFLSDEEIETAANVNYLSLVKITRDISLKKLLNKGASLVYISSVAANLTAGGKSLYASSKAAICQFAKSVAVDLASRGVRSNSISLGIVETKMNKTFYDEHPEMRECNEKKHLLGFGKPEDVSSLAQFLLSDASSWITGADIVIDGGYSAWK